jgi:hypothetical protein
MMMRQFNGCLEERKSGKKCSTSQSITFCISKGAYEPAIKANDTKDISPYGETLFLIVKRLGGAVFRAEVVIELTPRYLCTARLKQTSLLRSLTTSHSTQLLPQIAHHLLKALIGNLLVASRPKSYV